jgi:hypothetical protein
MRIYYFIFILIAAFSFTGCKKKSDVAPQGAQGSSGTQGLKKQGTISGTITGKRSNGAPINESFNYEYFDNSDESNWDSSGTKYYFTAYRRDSYESQDYISFDASNLDFGSTTPNSTNFSFSFRFTKVLDSGLVLEFGEFKPVLARLDFYNSSSTLQLSNYSFEPNSGRLKFDYEVDLTNNENYSGNTATVIGKVDVVVERKYL